MREWSDIEHELAADQSFARGFALPSARRERFSRWAQYFYPGGYLGCVLMYMCFATNGAQFGIIGGAILLGMAAWVVVEARVCALVRRQGDTRAK
jgi:hypothetical protein